MSAPKAAQKMAQRTFSLKLYKAILYVREEFKLHKQAKPEHLRGFFEQWINYLNEMHHMPAQTEMFGKYGRSLSAAESAHFSAEQHKQLQLLHKQTERLFEELDDGSGSSGTSSDVAGDSKSKS